ncbi:MAG: SDR family oxidoreductase [Burkholderiaceae bacterium]|nr:SDR family oxidoreductase [Burkholderiaceae bacterium]
MAMDMNQRVALITGANTGIGRITALALADRGYQLILAGRSLERTKPVLDNIRRLDKAEPLFFELRLDDLDSVRACADAVLATNLPIHLLINNAGLALQRGQTRQGYELAFGVNHLGHFLLTHLLLGQVISSAPARIINVASRAHRMTNNIPWEHLREPTRSLTGTKEYAVSKACNILFTKELARRLEGTNVSCFGLHPGVVATDIWRATPFFMKPFVKFIPMLTPEDGAKTTLFCIESAEPSQSGQYFANCRVAKTTPLASDLAFAEYLWKFSGVACA